MSLLGADEQGGFQIGGDAENILIADQKPTTIDRTVQVNSQLNTDTNPRW